ncbi:MAG: prephenate dehydratase [Calditrichaeota bacterium]|nr:MAG: prephenate dehydratase [Calditrichota bacterium]
MAKIKAAFQGERGAFSEVASRQFLGDSILPVPCESFEDLFDTVEKGKAKYGVVPIENTLVGSIHKNYDLLLERDLKVIGETYLRINHCLIGSKKISLKNVSKVYSHPVALDQCREFFKKYQTIAPISYYDTAGAVKMIAEIDSLNAAAIAGPYTAELYNLKVLKKSIEDEKTNFTRFLLLSKNDKPFNGKAKTSIVFSMKNQPGVLYKALSIFSIRDIDLTKIESRPLRKKAWQYHFYIDFQGYIKEERVKNALNHLKEISDFIKILGSYPQAER